MILDCHSIDFSDQSSQKRIAVANEMLGIGVTKRILSFSLYLFGASRISITTALDIPSDTIKSLTKRIHQKGVVAFNDGRCTNVLFNAPRQRKETTSRISINADTVIINLGLQEDAIDIPVRNTMQLKVVLLTLLNAGLITAQEVSQVLDYSVNHVHFLNKELHDKDVYALIDKRHGQQQRYRFTPNVKSQLILQFILDLASEGKTSGRLLSEHIKERSELELSERSIRYHVEQLGLKEIKKEVSACLTNLKKILPDN